MSKLKQLIHEVHHRSLWQVLGIYVVGSWFVLQVVDTMVGALKLPDWAPPLALILLIIGLPIVLATAFVQEGVRPEASPEAGQESEERALQEPRSHHRLFTWRNALLGGVAAGLLWGGVAIGWFLFGRGPDVSTAVAEPSRAEEELAAGDRSIAVLPLANRSSLEEDQFFVDGIHDDILSHLSKIGSLTVISRTSVMQYRGTEKPMREIGRELGVATVLEGGVQRAGDRVRVNVQLIDAETDRHLWAETYDEELTTASIFAIQTDVARKIANALRATLAPEVEARLATQSTTSLEAYDLYTRASYVWDARSTVEDAEQAADLFRRAIEEDPEYAEPYAALAEFYLFMYAQLNLPGAEALPEARALAERALELNGSLAEAHAALARVFRSELRFEEAEQAYLRAVELDPSSVPAHIGYGRLLEDLGRHDEAVRVTRRAVELDPVSIGTRINLAVTLFFAHDFDESMNESLKILELEPENAMGYYFLGAALSLSGEHEEAIVALQRSVDLNPSSPSTLPGLAWVYARAGQRDKALEILAEVPERSQLLKEIAIVYGELGEIDRAFEYLDRAYEEDPGTLTYMRSDPSADPLKDDPRFDALMRKLGLE